MVGFKGRTRTGCADDVTRDSVRTQGPHSLYARVRAAACGVGRGRYFEKVPRVSRTGHSDVTIAAGGGADGGSAVSRSRAAGASGCAIRRGGRGRRARRRSRGRRVARARGRGCAARARGARRPRLRVEAPPGTTPGTLRHNQHVLSNTTTGPL